MHLHSTQRTLRQRGRTFWTCLLTGALFAAGSSATSTAGTSSSGNANLTPQQAAESAASTQPLNEIRDELRRMVKLLSDQTEIQRSSLLIERLRIESEAMQKIDEELRSATESRDSTEGQLRVMTEQANQEEEQLRRQVEDDSSEHAREELERLRDQVDLMSANLQPRLSQYDAQVIELENELHDRKLRYDTLRNRVDEMLGLDG